MENPGSSRQLKSHDLAPGIGISLRYQGYHLALCETWPHSLGADAARGVSGPIPSLANKIVARDAQGQIAPQNGWRRMQLSTPEWIAKNLGER